MNEKILLIEDDQGLSELLQEELETEGYELLCAENIKSGTALLKEYEPGLVISDLRLPDGDGLSLIPILEKLQPRPSLLIITAFGSIQQAVSALKAGADDFLTKPMEMDHFIFTVARLLETRRMRHELQRYRSAFEIEKFHGILGQSAAMHKLYDEITRIASAEGPVLVMGESGTGKELVARAIHEESTRANNTFMAINCGGIPAELIESEFFGHTAGAFTGAGKTRAGLFQQTNGGTLMLDEIGEMPLALQAKLLRVLQDGRIRPVGSDEETQLDVRIIAATNRDLAAMVEAREFREDLFFRLETFAIQVPALRQRQGDIELLANHFLTQFAVRKQRHVQGFTDAALLCLKHYAFPGNVRELQNAVERAVTFCEGTLIEPDHLPERIAKNTYDAGSSKTPELDQIIQSSESEESMPTLHDLQQRYVKKVLNGVKGNKRKAAEILGITRKTLYRWLEK